MSGVREKLLSVARCSAGSPEDGPATVPALEGAAPAAATGFVTERSR